MTSTPEGSEAAYLWTRARLLAAEVAVSRPAAALLLPEALRLAEPPTATLFVADYPETRFGSVYREAAVLLHVSDDRGPALHCPWMVVDEDTALILGREVLGFPKKMAEIALEERGAHVVGTVRRRGTEVMRLEAELGAPEVDPAPLFAQRVVNVIGTLVGGLQLVELPPAQESIRASRRAEVKVTLASSDRDPLAELGAAPSGRARYLELDFGAEGGPQPALLGAVDAAWTERRFFARAL
jgi:acetoacetate decarboxylase